MRILDSRRLTGPNLHLPRAGVVAEVAFAPGEDAEAGGPHAGGAHLGDARGEGEEEIAAWRDEVLALAKALDLPIGELRARRFSGGAALSFSAPLDVLLAASDLNDLAIARASARVERARLAASGAAALASLEEALAPIRESVAMQRNPRLLALEAEAMRRDLPLLWDEEQLSLGMGATSRAYPMRALPAIAEVPWSELARLPTALITGTNGKTTSARLLAHLVAQEGKRVGLAATDFISIDGSIVERGDFTGPAAARRVLRDPRTEVAVLETARGGILRRGLAFDRADCALITNVADDHLGEYGIDTIEALARAKGVVARAVGAAGRIALNADDPASVALWRAAPELFAAPIVWFSLCEFPSAKALIEAHLAAGGEALLLEDGVLVRRIGEARTELLAAREVPISFGGAATFNLSNALGAAALAFALGLSREAIVRGLASFLPDAKDNPGRGNLFAGPRGVRVLIDFGHNAHGVHHLARLVAGLRLARASASAAPLTTIAACAGDRSDENLRALAVELAAMGPRRIFLRDLPDYLRGRAPGEVPRKLRERLAMLGMPTTSIELRESEADALARALETAEEDELVLVLVHLEEEAVSTLLERHGFQ